MSQKPLTRTPRDLDLTPYKDEGDQETLLRIRKAFR